MALSSYKILTFDVVGTLIDFEAGVVNAIRPIAEKVERSLDDETVLAAYGNAEGVEHNRTPGLPFPSMLEPIYRSMAAKLGLPTGAADIEALHASIPDWPAFPDTVDALKRLRKRFRLVAMTNSDNWALS